MDVEDPCRRRPIHDPVVDLVGDHGDAPGSTRRGDVSQSGCAQDRAGRVRGRRQHQAGQFAGPVEMLGRRRPSCVGPDRDRNRRHPEGDQGVAVAGISGFEHADPITGFEHGEERERETRRGAGHHHDPTGVDTLAGRRDDGEATAARRHWCSRAAGRGARARHHGPEPAVASPAGRPRGAGCAVPPPPVRRPPGSSPWHGTAAQRRRGRRPRSPADCRIPAFLPRNLARSTGRFAIPACARAGPIDGERQGLRRLLDFAER